MSIDHTRYCESTLLFGLARDSNGPLNRGVTLIIIVRVFGDQGPHKEIKGRPSLHGGLVFGRPFCCITELVVSHSPDVNCMLRYMTNYEPQLPPPNHILG